MRTELEVQTVLELAAHGLKDREIAERTGVPRRTIADWRGGRVPKRGRGTVECAVCGGRTSELPSTAYSYLLGLYLGDGDISQGPRTYRLRFSLDAAYPQIVEACAAALTQVMPKKRPWVKRRPASRCIDVVMYSVHWPCLFPQHGPGRKHERRILLEDWQREIVASRRRSLLRGLVHSDGCRIVANDRGRPSVRYHFTNRSEDIKDLFCEQLDALGITWTRPCDRQLAVYRKAAVAALDEFIGPKK